MRVAATYSRKKKNKKEAKGNCLKWSTHDLKMATKQDHLIQIKTNLKNSEIDGVPLFAISDFLCSDEFKRLQDQIFRNFETFMAQSAKNEKDLLQAQQQQNELEKNPMDNLTSAQIQLIEESQNSAKDLFVEQDNKYVCKICGKELKKSNSIEDHIRTHTGEKPYKCSECNKCFSQAVSLNLHMRVHSALPRDNKCNICMMVFATHEQLLEHVPVHADMKRYPCMVCNKFFSSSSKLRRHLPMHTGEKRYTCSVCDKRFTQSSSLNKHFRTCHPSNGGNE